MGQLTVPEEIKSKEESMTAKELLPSIYRVKRTHLSEATE